MANAKASMLWVLSQAADEVRLVCRLRFVWFVWFVWCFCVLLVCVHLCGAFVLCLCATHGAVVLDFAHASFLCWLVLDFCRLAAIATRRGVHLVACVIVVVSRNLPPFTIP